MSLRLLQWRFLKYAIALVVLLVLYSCKLIAQPLPPRITASQLAIIVNEADPLSVQIGEYYQQKRQIPSGNLIRVRFAPGETVLSPEEFQRIQSEVLPKLSSEVQAIALTWAAPYRVGCMSITTAFTLGFDQRYCANGCQPTALSPYFNSSTHKPYTDLQVRPTIAIAATSFESAKALIDRGIAADRTNPRGTAYLLSTSDPDRNRRAQFYAEIQQNLSRYFNIKVLRSNTLEDQWDVMFYFTGLPNVENIDSNRFLPGAIADHMTSTGGMLTNSDQMSSLRWLELGATGSYGAVIEPCNFPQKFPHPGLVMLHYLRGDTLIEAYWKSVAWPGQGIFIGEPLSRPFSRDRRSPS